MTRQPQRLNNNVALYFTFSYLLRTAFLIQQGSATPSITEILSIQLMPQGTTVFYSVTSSHQPSLNIPVGTTIAPLLEIQCLNGSG